MNIISWHNVINHSHLNNLDQCGWNLMLYYSIKNDNAIRHIVAILCKFLTPNPFVICHVSYMRPNANKTFGNRALSTVLYRVTHLEWYHHTKVNRSASNIQVSPRPRYDETWSVNFYRSTCQFVTIMLYHSSFKWLINPKLTIHWAGWSRCTP